MQLPLNAINVSPHKGENSNVATPSILKNSFTSGSKAMNSAGVQRIVPIAVNNVDTPAMATIFQNVANIQSMNRQQQQQQSHIVKVKQPTQIQIQPKQQQLQQRSQLKSQQRQQFFTTTLQNSNDGINNGKNSNIMYVNSQGNIIQHQQHQQLSKLQQKPKPVVDQPKSQLYYHGSNIALEQQQQEQKLYNFAVNSPENRSLNPDLNPSNQSESMAVVSKLKTNLSCNINNNLTVQNNGMENDNCHLSSDDVVIVNGTQMTDELSARILQSMSQKSFNNKILQQQQQQHQQLMQQQQQKEQLHLLHQQQQDMLQQLQQQRIQQQQLIQECQLQYQQLQQPQVVHINKSNFNSQQRQPQQEIVQNRNTLDESHSIKNYNSNPVVIREEQSPGSQHLSQQQVPQLLSQNHHYSKEFDGTLLDLRKLNTGNTPIRSNNENWNTTLFNSNTTIQPTSVISSHHGLNERKLHEFSEIWYVVEK